MRFSWFLYKVKYSSYLIRKIFICLKPKNIFFNKVFNSILDGDFDTNKHINKQHPIYTELTDRYKCREYVKSVIDNKYLLQIYGVYHQVKDINFDDFPNKFVLQCTHRNDSAIFFRSKIEHDMLHMKDRLNYFMKTNMYYTTGETYYMDIQPRIVCEEFIDVFDEQDPDYTARSYCIHCFHSEPVFFEVKFICAQGITRVNIYDINWKIQSFSMGYPGYDIDFPPPIFLDEMKDIAKKVSYAFPYMHVDILASGDNIYFNKLGFIPCRGLKSITSN